MNDFFDSAFFGPAVWAGFGVFLMIAEFFLPGAVTIFFGLGALLTGAATYYGLTESLYSQFFFWVISSIILTVLLRRQVVRWFPSIEKRERPLEEEIMIGKSVEALTDIATDADAGRVRYLGSSWQARSVGAPIPRGARTRIVGRENLLLLVEPWTDESAGHSGDAPDSTRSY
jgi:inner membrane protein